MTKPPDLVTILNKREVAELRDILEQTMTAAFEAGLEQGNEIWPTIAAVRALCDSHEVLRRKLANCQGSLKLALKLAER